MTKRLTNPQFLEKLEYTTREITPLEEYINSYEKILCRCNKCLNEWKITPNKLLDGRGCPKCNIIAATKTHEEFISQLYDTNKNIEVLGKYVNDRTKIQVCCIKHRHTWDTTPSRLLQGTGCKKCKEIGETTSHDAFITKVKTCNPSLDIVGKYNGRNNIICVKCSVCYHEWNLVARSVLCGHGCPSCKKSGFNPTKPAQFYIYKTDEFCGFGITNIPHTRHSEHNRTFKSHNISAELICVTYNHGQKILNLERDVKKKFKIVNTHIKGFKTEAISLNDMELLIAYINEMTTDKY